MIQLLQQGLIMTVIGMTLVFAGLAALWGLMALLVRYLPPEPEVKEAGGREQEASPPADATGTWASEADIPAETERARVAAIVAGLSMVEALPCGLPPVEPGSADGQTPDQWINSNRARALQSWQPRVGIEE